MLITLADDIFHRSTLYAAIELPSLADEDVNLERRREMNGVETAASPHGFKDGFLADVELALQRADQADRGRFVEFRHNVDIKCTAPRAMD